jgi:hypothetical protein
LIESLNAPINLENWFYLINIFSKWVFLVSLSSLFNLKLNLFNLFFDWLKLYFLLVNPRLRSWNYSIQLNFSVQISWEKFRNSSQNGCIKLLHLLKLTLFFFMILSLLNLLLRLVSIIRNFIAPQQFTQNFSLGLLISDMSRNNVHSSYTPIVKKSYLPRFILHEFFLSNHTRLP